MLKISIELTDASQAATAAEALKDFCRQVVRQPPSLGPTGEQLMRDSWSLAPNPFGVLPPSLRALKAKRRKRATKRSPAPSAPQRARTGRARSSNSATR